MNTSADLTHALAWSLLHFLWQGAAIAALAAALMALFRAATTRYLVGIAALVLMLACFGTTFALMREPRIAPGTQWVEAAPAAAAAEVRADAAAARPGLARTSGLSTSAERDFAWVARGWLAGVCLLALRIAFGLLLLEQLRRRNLTALPGDIVRMCRTVQRRLGISRLVRYCECRLVTVPSVIGFVRPIVLLPVRALTGLSAEQLEAVIAHELGHVKRFDVAVNLFQVVTETLFFFHPAVWWLNQRIRADREDCCDDVAVAVCGRHVSYARALATMEGWRDAPALAMAATGSPVAARVARLLGVSRPRAAARGAGVFTASVVLAGALLAGAASVGMATPATPPLTPARAATPAMAPAMTPAPAEAPAAAESAARAAAPAVAAVPAAVPVRAAQVVKPPQPPRAAPPMDRGASKGAQGSSFIAEMESAGFKDLDVDELIALRVHGVTGEYVRAMRQAGYQLDAGQVAAMKSQDVTPEYIAQMRALGFAPDADEIVGMKAQDITPQYVKAMRAAGFAPDAEQITGMKVQGVTPDYVAQMRALGFKPDAGEIIAMKAMEVTPEYVKALRGAGLNPDADQIAGMKAQEVTPDYLKALEAAGFKPEDVDELIAAKAMDITPEFIAQVQSHGFKNLTLQKIIHLKNADVL
jgi:beta-lactamase regulating signal transducer with metallopeptidase domain